MARVRWQWRPTGADPGRIAVMRVREVDVRFVDGVDRRRVVALGDAIVGVLSAAATAELVSLSVSGVDLATFAFAGLEPAAPVPLLSPTVGPTGAPSNTSWPVPAPAESAGAAPAAEDCREAVLAAADGLGAGRVEIVADRLTSIPAEPVPAADHRVDVSPTHPATDPDPV